MEDRARWTAASAGVEVRAALDALSVPALLIGADDEVLVANPGAEELFGAVPVGTRKKFKELPVSWTLTGLRTLIEGVKAGGGIGTLPEVPWAGERGQLYVDVTAAPVLDAGGVIRAVLVTAIVVSLLAVGWLWTQFGFRTHGGSCFLAPASGRLEARGFATYLIGTGGLGTAVSVAVSWPPGYSAVPDGSGELSVRDASGREVARTGTETSLTGGDSGNEWQVCEVSSRS